MNSGESIPYIAGEIPYKLRYLGIRSFSRVPEEYSKQDCHYKCIASENVPCHTPVRLWRIVDEMIYDSLGGKGTDCRAYTVGHQHKEALGTGLYLI